MIIIPLSFFAMWIIMLCGVMTNCLAKISNINKRSPDHILWHDILKKFFRKEWASYCMSVIFTGIVAYSFVFMKKFDHIENDQITKWAKWIPLAVLFLYGFGILNQWLLYRWLGRIQSNGKIDIDILEEKKAGS